MFSTLQLVKASQTPLYLQLANGLGHFIENGQLCSGTKLPSIRFLAKELKINRDTVVSAYKILEQRGLTYGQTGSGTYVSDVSSPTSLDPFGVESFSLENKNLVNFLTTTLPSNHCPIEIFESLSSNLFLTEGWNAFHDKDGSKHDLLLQEVCNYFHRCGILSAPKQTRIVNNLSQLLHSLPKLANKPEICIESPCKNISIFQQYGFKTYEVPLALDGMDMDVLEDYLENKNIQYIYVTPYLQNPTGICYSDSKRQRLLALAKKYGAYIIEEDTYSDLLQKGLTYVPIYSSSTHHHVIYIKNFSELYLPKLSYLFVILPPTLANMATICLQHDFVDSLFYQYLYNGVWQQNKNFLMPLYKANYQKLLELINTYLIPYVSYSCSWGGIYIWLTLNHPYITAQDLCNALIAHHVIVSPGSLFYTERSDIHHIRMSIAQVSIPQMERGIQVMASLLHSKKLP